MREPWFLHLLAVSLVLYCIERLCDGKRWIAPMVDEVTSKGWTLVPILHLEILTSRVGELGGHFEGGVGGCFVSVLARWY